MINNLQKMTLADFSGGRVTSENQATVPKNCLTVAKNILVHAGAVQPVSGYTKVIDTTLSKVERLFSFQRQSDSNQFLVACGGSKVALCSIDGSGAPKLLSNVEQGGDFDFITGPYALYMNNGITTKKVLNISGVDTLVPWGMQPVISPPSVNIGSGSLFLVYGRQYVVAEVFRWTDSKGVVRYDISIPGGFSAHSGPLGSRALDGVMTSGSGNLSSVSANFNAGDVGKPIRVVGAGSGGSDLITTIQTYTDASHVVLTALAQTSVTVATFWWRTGAVTVGSLAPVNPQTTHFWIFATVDSALGTSGDYFFAAEVPVTSTQWVDVLDDSGLDTTRSAPWDNHPAPNGTAMLSYASRAAILNGDTVSFSALDEILLGDPMSCFPTGLEVTLPVGSKPLVGGTALPAGTNLTYLMLANVEGWFRLNGSSEADFVMSDQMVVQPGLAGRKLVMIVNGRMYWIAPDRKLWCWNGVQGSDPYVASKNLLAPGNGQLSLNDLDLALLSKCELQLYSNGTYHFLVLASTSNQNTQGEKDWISLWDLSPITGVLTIQGPLPVPAETDFIPNDLFLTSLVASGSDGVPYVYFGSAIDGTVYRWPDGFQFNGQEVHAAMCTPWIQYGDAKARACFLKLLTNLPDAKDYFRVFVSVSKGVTQNASLIEVQLEDDIDGAAIDTTVARANLMAQEGTSYGNWIKVYVVMPEKPADLGLAAIELYYVPLFGV